MSQRQATLDATALDAADPLATLIDRFAPTEPGVVYFDGNSLGRPTKLALERMAYLGESWAERLIRGWDEGWLDLPLRVGDQLAEGVLGARQGEVAVVDSTTVNLYRVASAALDARPGRRTIVIERSEFPTDRYIVEGLARERDLEIRWLDGDPIEGLSTNEIAAATREVTALLILSAVNYRSAAIVDMKAVTHRAREAGALVLWDLSHAGGSIPVDLEADGIDLAVGCTYKYLNGGPGAPAYLYVRRELQDELRPPIQGWFAQMDQFEMGAHLRAPAGHRGLARRNTADPRVDRSPGGRRARGRGRHRRDPRQGHRPDRVRDRAHRRMARTAWLLDRLAARRHVARRPCRHSPP